MQSGTAGPSRDRATWGPLDRAPSRWMPEQETASSAAVQNMGLRVCIDAVHRAYPLHFMTTELYWMSSERDSSHVRGRSSILPSEQAVDQGEDALVSSRSRRALIWRTCRL